MRAGLTILIIYTTLLTLVLYGTGTAYSITTFNITMPTPPDNPNPVTEALYLGSTAMAIIAQFGSIIIVALETLVYITSQFPILTVLIMVIPTICMIDIVYGLARLARGGG